MKIQIARTIFLVCLDIMKKILDLGQFKLGKKSEDFIYYKKEVMNYFYDSLKKLFKILEQNKVIEKCSCGANIRKGYSECEKCGGAGYINKK